MENEKDKIFNAKVLKIKAYLNDFSEVCHNEAEENNHACGVDDEEINDLLDFLSCLTPANQKVEL